MANASRIIGSLLAGILIIASAAVLLFFIVKGTAAKEVVTESLLKDEKLRDEISEAQEEITRTEREIEKTKTRSEELKEEISGVNAMIERLSGNPGQNTDNPEKSEYYTEPDSSEEQAFSEEPDV